MVQLNAETEMPLFDRITEDNVLFERKGSNRDETTPGG